MRCRVASRRIRRAARRPAAATGSRRPRASACGRQGGRQRRASEPGGRRRRIRRRGRDGRRHRWHGARSRTEPPRSEKSNEHRTGSLDKLAASAFDGYLVRKDLVRKYCAPVSGADLRRRVPARALLRQHRREGDRRRACRSSRSSCRTARSAPARRSCSRRARARTGSVKLIDIVRARLDAKNDCYLAELPSLALRDVRIADKLVHDNERMLTDGFYAEVTLSYDAVIAQEQGGRPFAIDALRPIQMSKSDVLDVLRAGPQSVHHGGVDRLPDPLDRPGAGGAHRAREDGSRCCAWCRSSSATTTWWNSGPRGTGKSHLFQQISPYCAPDLRRQGDGREDVRQQRQRPARPGLPVRRRLLRRGVRHLLRSEGRRQHHEGLHGVGRSSAAARRASAPTAAS